MDLQATIAALYEHSLPRLRGRLEHLEAALAAGDLETAAAEAHTLTGTLGTFGEQAGSDAARELEDALREGGDVQAPLAVLHSALRRPL